MVFRHVELLEILFLQDVYVFELVILLVAVGDVGGVLAQAWLCDQVFDRCASLCLLEGVDLHKQRVIVTATHDVLVVIRESTGRSSLMIVAMISANASEVPLMVMLGA